MYDNFTKSAQLALELAEQAALGWNHEYYGTEHMLAGLVNPRLMESTAGDIFAHFEIQEGAIRKEVENVVQPGPPMTITAGTKLPKTPRTKVVLEYALEEARARGTPNHVNTGDLLIGLFRESEGMAAHILTMAIGLKLTDVREFLAKRAAKQRTNSDDGLVVIKVNEGLFIQGTGEPFDPETFLPGLAKIMQEQLTVTGVLLLGTKKD